jgi:ArsR family transcriptional regulator, arsenate/arsenite/antimonite-responsive transcriptional repressor / arsenate reductase (thioredoxin)
VNLLGGRGGGRPSICSSIIDSTAIEVIVEDAIIPDAPTGSNDLERRAAVHRALGDVHRLAVVEALRLGDRAPSELAELTGLGTNLVAFHLEVLEAAGLIMRAASEGDRRRRYVRLQRDVLRLSGPVATIRADDVLFVCTANSARSQLAAALWERSTGRPAWSAGQQPADRVHPDVIAVAAARGLDLRGRRPRGYDQLETVPDLVVSVCDRAREAGLPFDVPSVHWSVPDPLGAGAGVDAVAQTYDELDTRIAWLAASRAAAA